MLKRNSIVTLAPSVLRVLEKTGAMVRARRMMYKAVDK